MNPITMKLVVDDLILQALREDITFEDVSTASVCPTARPATVELIAKADGTLQGPSEDATTIDNHSAYGIHVTNMKIDAMNTWTIAADAKAGTAQNSIDFKVGPDGALQNASAAMQGTGLDLSKNAAFDMGYQGIAGGTDKIKLKTSGNVARVTRDIFRVTGEGDQVATITWTVEPGAHTA